MNRFSFDDHPNYRVKQPNLLYIDRYGNIYPDCKTYKTPILCHITDKTLSIWSGKRPLGLEQVAHTI